MDWCSNGCEHLRWLDWRSEGCERTSQAEIEKAMAANIRGGTGTTMLRTSQIDRRKQTKKDTETNKERKEARENKNYKY